MKKNRKPNMYRQGDVLIVEVTEIPAIIEGKGRCVLAFGEVTGHCHEVKIKDGLKFWIDPHTDQEARTEIGNKPSFDAATWLEVTNLIAEVTHQEHDTIKLPTGKYKIKRQREYSPQSIRSVQD